MKLWAKSGIAFLDQAILSGTNFVVAVILMKTVGKEEYGYYSTAFAISLFLVSLQNAVVTTPLAVLLAGKPGDKKDDYVAALYWGQIISVIPAAAIGLAAMGMMYFAGIHNIVVLTIGSICFAAVGILLREFSRAYHFARQSPTTVLLLDSCYALTYVVLLAVVHFSFQMSAPVAFLLMGASALLAAVVFRGGKWQFNWPAIRRSYAEHWPFARWSLTGVLVTHVQSYCNLYLTGTLLGGSAAGSLAASKLPMSPLTLLQAGWNKVAIPRGAHLREKRQLGRFLKEQALVAIMIAMAVVAYVAVLLVSADFLKKVLFNGGYEGALDLIWYWAAINMIGFAGLSASVGLQVMKEFGIIAKTNCVTMVITVAANVMLIGRYGIRGGLISSLLGESLLAASLWWCLGRRYLRDAHPATEGNGMDLLRRLLPVKKGVSL